ncbi:MAG: glycosyltransferase family 4 protein, partial [Clostridia bacterium]|nr:glycosyltransferase family 4 protein [Clostridia bacterium]
ATNVPWLLWDLIAMRGLHIPVIFLNHFNFAWSFSAKGAELRPKMEAAFKSADAVICLSRTEELYERMQGINAVYLPPAIRQYPWEERQEAPQKIAVLGRLGDPVKQVGESLKIMQRVAAKAPWVSMYLIGDFYTDEQRAEYRQILKEYGLERNVILTGVTEQPELFLKECGILLSVSAWEGFPMNIAEAQALGLPCVIYDIPIEIARNNPSIISVPQGDVIKASDAILELLENPEKWRQLSRVATEKSRQFAPEKITKALKGLLGNLDFGMITKTRNKEEYEDIIRYSAWYSGKKFAWKWQNILMERDIKPDEITNDAEIIKPEGMINLIPDVMQLGKRYTEFISPIS